jgi:hypothetical protein
MNKENYMATTIITLPSLFYTYNFIFAVRGFKTYCVSHLVSGTDDEILWENGHEENSSSRVENASSD